MGFLNRIKEIIHESGIRRLHGMFLVWFVWMLVGTAFYAHNFEENTEPLGYARGVYMAVNVGYSIGWGDISENYGSKIFSTFYCLTGASFVGVALSYFADKIQDSSRTWYQDELDAKKKIRLLRKYKDRPFRRAWTWAKYNWDEMKSVYLWFIIVACATTGAMLENNWPFFEALYFAVSSLSTGGLQAIPYGSTQWSYGLTGVYCMFGIPLMGVAMGNLATKLMKHPNNLRRAQNAIFSPVTDEEIRMLHQFGMASEDGFIDRDEFTILQVARLGTSPEVIQLVRDYFDNLDKLKSGRMRIKEIKKSTGRVHAFKEALKKGASKNRAQSIYTAADSYGSKHYQDDDDDGDDDESLFDIVDEWAGDDTSSYSESGNNPLVVSSHKTII